MAFTQQQLIEQRLKKHFPDPKIELNYENKFQLLIVIILSPQTTDKKVNQISPILFKKYPTPQALANADLKDLKKY
jgi:endonuclease-3